jgi:hypothetical protein
MKQFIFSILTVLTFVNVKAQLPNSDVWLFSYSAKGGNYSFTNGKNVSNRPGYDNQPFFSNDGTKMLYTTELKGGNTTFAEFDVKTGKQFLVQTGNILNISSYSPEFTYGTNFVNAVVVEKDSTQRLWKFYMGIYDTVNLMTDIYIPSVKNVAYSRWYNDSIVFLCILPEPMNLFVANVKTGVVSKCAMNVNRSMCVLHQKNRDLFLYSQMKADSSYAIQALSNTGTHISDFEPIPFLKGSQDFTVDKSGNVFMASGTKLYCWTTGKSKEWKEVGDFASSGLHKITRLMMSPDGKHIALVENTN